MDESRDTTELRGAAPRPTRARTPKGAARASAWLLGVTLLALAPAARAQAPDSDGVAAPVARTLRAVEFAGRTHTSAALALRATGLALPAPATPEAIAAATARLRESRLFRDVEAHTRPGDRPGDVVLVFDVRENHPSLRFGLGYEDYSSWYLIPAQLNADNLTGHGESLRLGARFGYRTSGVDLALRSTARASARDFWELRLGGESVDRVYFLDSTETKQRIQRGVTSLRVGRALPGGLALESWLALGTTRVDSNASVYTDHPASGRRAGDLVPFAALPADIRRDVRDRPLSRLGASLLLDRRLGDGLETRGVWARAAAEGAFSPQGDFGSWQADVRGYAPLTPELQLAVRVRGAFLSRQAPFYERYYAGGLYTVRGYPSQSLSPPGGDLDLAAGSLELRHVWWGSSANPRFAAIAFVDGGASWSGAAPPAQAIAWGAGYGFRARVPWLGYIGLDVAKPLSPTPVHESFHLNGSLGWAF